MKDPIGEPEKAPTPGGLRGRRAKKKIESIENYMKQVDALVATYLPPSAEKIQKCQDAGKFSIEMPEPGKRAILRFKDYNLPGDSVGVEVDLTSNTVTGLQVASYVGDPSGTVTLNASLERLADATLYPASISLVATAVEIDVEVTNTDYKASMH